MGSHCFLQRGNAFGASFGYSFFWFSPTNMLYPSRNFSGYIGYTLWSIKNVFSSSKPNLTNLTVPLHSFELRISALPEKFDDTFPYKFEGTFPLQVRGHFRLECTFPLQVRGHLRFEGTFPFKFYGTSPIEAIAVVGKFREGCIG